MSDQNANNGTVPVFAPDGSLGDIPAERLADAVKAGFKPGVTMKAQDGSLGVIPANRVPDAAKGGLSIVPLGQQETQHPGFWHSVYSDLAGMMPHPSEGGVPSPYPGVTPEVGQANWKNATAQAQSEKDAGYSRPYMAAAGVAQGVGVNVPGMEQSAKEGDVAGVAGHAVAGAAPIVAGEVIHQAGPSLADVISEHTPSAMRDAAGQLFQSVKAKAGNFPVDVEAPGQLALNMKTLYERGAGYTPPSVVNRFLQRVTKPDAPPMTYEEARDFYSNASRLSADEALKLTPKAKMVLGQFTQALGQSIQNAANQAGVGMEHAQAMRDYAMAMQYADKVQAMKDVSTKVGVKAALGAAGGAGAAAAYEGYKALKDQ